MTAVFQTSVPPDATLQRMTDAQLEKLWRQRPQWAESATGIDWVRVAKELRYRERFAVVRRSMEKLR